MAEGNDHTCLICQAKFADALDFYEHVMEHGEDGQSEEEELDHLPGTEPSAAATEPGNLEERLSGVCGAYPGSPSDSEPISPAFPPPHNYGLPLPPTHPLAPSTNFLAHKITSPQNFFQGIPYRFSYPTHVPMRPPPLTYRLPALGDASQQYSPVPTYPVEFIVLSDDESESTPRTKSIGQQYREMEEFTVHFKERRIRLGYTQASVGVSMEKHYGIAFSQTTVSRFEAMQLNFHNLAKLRPLFEEWLDYEEQEIAKSQVNRMPFRRRKKRTSFQPQAKQALESHFRRQPTPNSGEYALLADALGLDKEVVRIWFCNRRQKERKTNTERRHRTSSSSQQWSDDVESETVSVSEPDASLTAETEADDISVSEP